MKTRITIGIQTLIQINLEAAHKLERGGDHLGRVGLLLNSLSELLADLIGPIDEWQDLDTADLCRQCKKLLKGEFAWFMDQKWHLECLKCSQCLKKLAENLTDARWCDDGQPMCYLHSTPNAIGGFVRIHELRQIAFNLQIAHARTARMMSEDTADLGRSTRSSRQILSSAT